MGYYFSGNQVENWDFDDDAAWTVNDWVIDKGKCSIDGTQVDVSALTQPLVCVLLRLVKVKIIVTEMCSRSQSRHSCTGCHHCSRHVSV